jgi:hypothetical protein
MLHARSICLRLTSINFIISSNDFRDEHGAETLKLLTVEIKSVP